MSCMITWGWSFLTSEVVEADRGQKHHISARTLALNVWFIPQCQFCLPKIYQEMRSVMTFSLHSASISRILEPSPQGLISSILYLIRLLIMKSMYVFIEISFLNVAKFRRSWFISIQRDLVRVMHRIRVSERKKGVSKKS